MGTQKILYRTKENLVCLRTNLIQDQGEPSLTANESFSKFLKLKEYLFLPFSDSSQEIAKLLWIIRLRWLVIAFLITLWPLGFTTGAIRGSKGLIYVGLLFLLICFNSYSHFVWSRRRAVHSSLIAMQLIFDLAILTSCLLLHNDSLNPFFVVFYVNVSLGATLLHNRWGVVFQVLCHLALLFVQLMSSGEIVHSHLSAAFLIQHLVLLIVWGVSRSLYRYIMIQNQKIQYVKIYAEKLDRLRSLGALAAGFSHEFASPLNTIKLRIEREQKLKPESENLSEIIQAVHECELVLRQMNGAQMDPRDFHFKVFNLSSATEEILKSWRQENPSTLVDFNSKDHQANVNLPILNYSQALINILDNAIEANPKGRVFIDIDPLDSLILLRMENEGSRFSEDVLNRFGEPFVTTKSTGTGLGLYSVQLFAQSFGGTAAIKNTRKGARVEIQIPRHYHRELDEQ